MPGLQPVLGRDAAGRDVIDDDVGPEVVSTTPGSNRANRTTTSERITPTPAMTIAADPESLVHASTVAEGHRRTGPGFPGTRPGMAGCRSAPAGDHDAVVTTSTAPTRRLGDDRRRFPRLLAMVFVALVAGGAVAGCIGFGLRPEPRSPVPAGPLGEIVADPVATGPPIECRGVARERCLSAGSVEGMIAGIEVSDAERVIVSCEGDPCTAGGRRDADRSAPARRTTVEVARGGYGEFRQP